MSLFVDGLDMPFSALLIVAAVVFSLALLYAVMKRRSAPNFPFLLVPSVVGCIVSFLAIMSIRHADFSFELLRPHILGTYGLDLQSVDHKEPLRARVTVKDATGTILNCTVEEAARGQFVLLCPTEPKRIKP